MTEDARPALLWFRQDLRMADHAALHAAVRSGRRIVPVYVLDDAATGEWAAGGASRWWLHHSLVALAGDLAAAGAKLVLRRGDSAAVLAELSRAVGAAEIYFGAAVEPWARALELRVRDALAAEGVALRRFRTGILFDPESIRTQAGGVYGVYTPFSRACFAAGGPNVVGAPGRILSVAAPASDRLADWGLLPTRPDWAGGLRAAWQPGEVGAQAALRGFLDGALERYAARRDFPGVAGTSRLSPHLHFGEISAGQVWQAVGAVADGANAEKFLKEILWREFSQYLLWHHPGLPEAPLRGEFARMPWRDDAAGLAAWQRGRTGVPIVDAGMRELWQTGWMHNRVRMVVASFLVKHLLIDWRAGARWFWDTLVDADLGSNAASWQWVAGSGADAAPYFRVFNPVLQGKKFDPDGAYVRRFVPELAGLSDADIHAPWEAPAAVLAAAGVVLGRDYPVAIVGLAEGRARALAAFGGLSGGGS